MLPKAVIVILGLPFALFCCLLVPVAFLTVFACSPLVYAYRCVTEPIQAGCAASRIAHPPSA
ncbi:hypothetical protein [Anaeroselena agilis]|uniref:Uncharacterized protein n=1 Tax=Anaeroselena agilis TaxID=3063788 RepID=A0ABU3NZ68_9FIRM|nr:hypothetical protein [Selenomonadales bacterium 4137-cl]